MPTGQPTAPTALVDEGITVSGGTYTTSAFTPTAGRLYYLFAIYTNDVSNAWTGAGSVSQTGMTWVRVGGSLQWNGSQAGEVFRSLPSSYSSGSQAATITPPTVPGGGILGDAIVCVVEVQDPDTSGTEGSGATLALGTDSTTSSGTSGNFTALRNDDESDAYSVGWNEHGEILLMMLAHGTNEAHGAWASTQSLAGNTDGYTDLKTGDEPSAPTELTDTGFAGVGAMTVAYTRQGAAAGLAAGAQGDVSWSTSGGTFMAGVAVKVATTAPTVTATVTFKKESTSSTITTTASPSAGDLQLVVGMDRSASTPSMEYKSGDSRGWVYQTVNTDPANTDARHTVMMAWREVQSGDSTTEIGNSANNDAVYQEFWVTPSDLTGTIGNDTDATEANRVVQTDGGPITSVQRMHGRVSPALTRDGIVFGVASVRNGSYAYTTEADGIFNGFTLGDVTSDGAGNTFKCLITSYRTIAAGQVAAPIVSGDTVDQEMTLVTFAFEWGVSASAAGGIVMPRHPRINIRHNLVR